MNSNSNGIEIARFRKLDCCSALTCTSCDTLLVDCTPRMTGLAAGSLYCYTMHTLVILHSARALLICGYTMETTLTQ